MEDQSTRKLLRSILIVLSINLGVLIIATGALILGLLPKIERAVATAERVESRFQVFADEVQPVVTAGAGKAIEAVKGMDAKRLSDKATDGTESLIESAAERARRMLESDKKD